ncbi:hypothetical protein [Candidatus Binatus sp.]|uniref:hypothetical protein n=1 Tax=Candidatus Binatus sp. TaxID=2811406 RepID=UPI003BB1FD2C
MIRISLKGLAKFMTSSSLTQRKTLRDYKFPEREGEAQATFYREARRFIRDFHQQGNPEGWLSKKASELRTLAQVRGAMSGIRLRHNSRALVEYEQYWGAKHFQVLKSTSLALHFHDVRISVFPDVHVLEDETEKIIKFEFSADEPSDEVLKIMSQAMFEAALEGGLGLSAKSVLILDVPRKRLYRGAKAGSKVRREIEAACRTISDIWPALESPRGGKQQAS